MYKPDYKKCTDNRKEVYWSVCKHMVKNVTMFCTMGAKNKPCPAWEGYSHGDE